jgi:hypothetical protein
MAIAEFPMDSVSAGNPRPDLFYQEPDLYQVAVSEYDDGGLDFALQAGGAGIKRWVLKYIGLTPTQAAILDAHLASAGYSDQFGSARSFNFRDRDTGILYSNVRYAPGGYVRVPHTYKQIQSREIILEKRP